MPDVRLTDLYSDAIRFTSRIMAVEFDVSQWNAHLFCKCERNTGNFFSSPRGEQVLILTNPQAEGAEFRGQKNIAWRESRRLDYTSIGQEGGRKPD